MIQTTNLTKFLAIQSYDVKLILQEFKRPILENSFFVNKKLLLDNSKLTLFDSNRWIMRPYVYCNDIYDEQYIYPIILLVNNIGSAFDFIPENFYKRIIITPSKSSILTILSTI